MIILASASDARRKLIKICKKNVVLKKSDINERRLPNESIYDYLQRITYMKSVKFLNRYSTIIGVDTVILFNDEVIGKPRDRMDAFNILKALSGEYHYCFSGVTLLSKQRYEFFVDCAVVYMKKLKDDEIEGYLDCEEYKGKAAGYAIQGKASRFMKVIKGDITTVIGLPVKRLCRII